MTGFGVLGLMYLHEVASDGLRAARRGGAGCILPILEIGSVIPIAGGSVLFLVVGATRLLDRIT